MKKLTHTRLEEIGNEMFGGERWGKKMAEASGLSQGMISLIRNGQPISERTSDAILAAYNEFKGGNKCEVAQRIEQRFNIMRKMTHGIIDGNVRSMIVSGAAGIGKTFDIENIMNNTDEDFYFDIINGVASPNGIYNALYKAKDGGVVVFDDCDSIFDEEDSLNIMKKALDSTEKRVISWRKRASWVFDPDNMSDESIQKMEKKGCLPNKFEFNGAIIFVTNLDFVGMINKGSKMAPHFKALMSRSMYIDLTLHSIKDKLVRMRQVFMDYKMYEMNGIELKDAEEIMSFVEDNADNFIELSLRLLKHVCDLYKVDDDWKDMVRVTKMTV